MKTKIGGMYNPARAYQSVTPTANAVLAQKWDEIKYRTHREKVATVKPVVDNKSPKVYMHLHTRLKKYVMEEQRMATIQKDNYHLLTRMAEIMHKKGQLDNVNNYTPKSMNAPIRQRELMRVAQENRAILARIEAARPHYNHKKWLNDWQDSKQYMSYISKFPHTGNYHSTKIKTKKLQPEPKALHSAYKSFSPN